MAATSAGQPMKAIAGDPSTSRLLTVLLGRFGIPVVESVRADGAESAVEAAWWLGFPVTLAVEGSSLTGQAEITRPGLATPAQVRMAYRRLAASLGAAMTGVRIRRQPQQGAEVIVRVVRDPAGAAQVSLLLGGPASALVAACVTRPAPLTPQQSRDMLDELHGGPSVTDAGKPAMLDLAALARLLERVGKLAAQVPEVTALELNPVIITKCGAAVAGVRGEFHKAQVAERPQARLKRVS